MPMTRRDYQAIAEVIAAAAAEWGGETDPVTRGVVAGWAITDIAHGLANYMQRTNAAFDRGRFITACQLTSTAGAPCAAERERGSADA